MIDYLNLEDVAVQRGEKSDLLARKLVANGCYLYLWFDNNRKHKAMMLFPGVSKKEMDYEFDQGTYPLTQGSREALIKILNRGENTTEGLEILIESDDGFNGFVKYQVRLTKEDDSVCVVVNPEDVAKLPPPSQIEGTSEASTSTAPKRNFLKKSPISIFIDEQISDGSYKWQEAWSELWGNIAENKNANIEDMKLHTFGEKEAFIKRTMKHTSNKLDYAIEYEEDGIPTFKTLSRQSFGRMFRRALKKSRTLSDSPK